jgi:RNA polymerase sigma factor (TIGR02999 family)
LPIFLPAKIHPKGKMHLSGSGGQITRLLHAWQEGDRDALNQVVELVYPELRKIAHGHLSRERPGHILQTTALVNESYLRMARLRRMSWNDRAHFCAMSARVMRRVLVDFRRANPHVPHPELSPQIASVAGANTDALVVDQALTKLAGIDARKAQIAEMKFFGDLTAEQIANVLSVSVQTVNRDWSLARAWLLREMSATGDKSAGASRED